MSFIKSGILGLFMGMYLSIFVLVGVIPVIGPIIAMLGAMCTCLVNPIVMIIFGFLACKFTGVKAGDYGAAGINLIIYSLAASVTFAIISLVAQLLGFGVGAVAGGDLTTLGMSAAGGALGIFIGLFIQFFMLLFLGLIGAVLYLVTKK